MLGEKRRLFPLLPPRREGFRAFGEGGNVPRIQLAIEANAQDPGGLPPDHRGTSERSAVQCHRRSCWQACRTIQLCAAGRQVEDPHRMTLSSGLKERRQRHLDPRIGAAIRMRISVLRGWNGACHHLASSTGVLPECKRRKSAMVESGYGKADFAVLQPACSSISLPVPTTHYPLVRFDPGGGLTSHHMSPFHEKIVKLRRDLRRRPLRTATLGLAHRQGS